MLTTQNLSVARFGIAPFQVIEGKRFQSRIQDLIASVETDKHCTNFSQLTLITLNGSGRNFGLLSASLSASISSFECW